MNKNEKREGKMNAGQKSFKSLNKNYDILLNFIEGMKIDVTGVNATSR